MSAGKILGVANLSERLQFVIVKCGGYWRDLRSSMALLNDGRVIWPHGKFGCSFILRLLAENFVPPLSWYGSIRPLVFNNN